MEFPTSQLQASVALTMFSPDVALALYGQLSNSEKTTNRNCRRDVKGSISEGGSERQQHARKSNLEKLGQLFRRKPNSSLEKISQTTIQSSRSEEKNTQHISDLEQILFREDSADLEDTFVTSIEDDSDIPYDERPSTPEIAKREGASASISHFRNHQRGESFHVNFIPDDVQRIATEIYGQTIADVHLSLFSYWINESEENYEEAKRHIRELRLDHGYNLARIANVYLRKLMQDVFNQRPVEARITLRKKVSLHETAMATSRTPTYSLFPRIDALPPPLRIERQRAVSQAALRSASMDRSSPSQRDYPPNTSDRPAPLSVRLSTATASSPNSFQFSFIAPESPPPLPFGFPSPRSTFRLSDNSFPTLASYTSSLYGEDDYDDKKTESSGDDNTPWESRVADIYERVVGLERPEQLDQVIKELQGLRALYCNTPIASLKKGA